MMSTDKSSKLPLVCVSVAYMCAASACILARSVGDTLFLSYFGRGYLSYMYIGTACVVGPLSYYFGIYARMKALHRVQIICCALLASVAIVLRFALASPSGFIRIATYFWADVTVYGSMLLFWTFFAQVFEVRQAKKVVGWVGAAGTSACIVAGFMIKPFVASFGTANLLIVVAAQMLVLAAMIHYGSRLEAGAQASQASAKLTALPGQIPNLGYYFDLLKSERVRKLAMQVAIATAATVLIDYQFKAGAQAHYKGAELAAFFGNFYAIANVCVLIIQLFVLKHLLNGRMLFVSLCILPLGLFLGSSATLLSASFLAVVGARFISQTTVFTIDTAALQILYLGVKKQSQNQVRSLIEGIAKPAAVGITGAVLVLLFKASFVHLFALIGMTLCVAWLFVARRNYRLYVQGLIEGLSSRILDVSGESSLLRNKAVEDYVRAKIKSAPPGEVRYLLGLIQELDDGDWAPEFRSLLQRSEADLKTAALEYLGSHGDKSDLQSILAHFHHPEIDVRCGAIRAASRLSSESILPALTELLRDREPQVRAEVASALIGTEDLGGVLEGVSVVKTLLDSKDETGRIAIAGPVSRLPFRGRTKFMMQLLLDPDVNVRIAALKACVNIKEPELVASVIAQALDSRTSEAAGNTLVSFGSLTLEHLSQYPPSALAETFESSSQLTQDMVRIGGSAALALLSGALDVAQGDSSFVLRAYCELFRKQDRAKNGFLAHWESLFQRKFEAALRSRDSFRGGLPLQNTVVLTRALRDEYEALVEDVFSLLDARFHEVNMRLIQSFLDSGNPQRRSQALEILENVLPAGLRGKVMTLIESQPEPLDAATAKRLICEIVESHQSDSILAGALYAAAETGLRETAGAIERRTASSDDRAVRETGGYALKKLSDMPRGETKMLIVETIVFLQNVPLFSAMTTNELIQLAYMTHETTYIAGSSIIEEGQPGDHMFIIVDGEVRIHRSKVELRKIGTKDFFGEMSIIDGEPRSASVTAVTDCLMLRIDQSEFLQLLWSRNSIAMSVIKTLTQRLRQTMTAYDEVR